MRERRDSVRFLVVGIAFWGVGSCTGTGPEGEGQGGDPGRYPLQDNPLAGCSICHVDVEDEFVGSAHFRTKTGCKTCHGPSKGHLADENNEVKPDQVFARGDVDRLCGACHDCGREKTAGKAHLDSGAAKKDPVCVDCHGAHRFKAR